MASFTQGVRNIYNRIRSYVAPRKPDVVYNLATGTANTSSKNPTATAEQNVSSGNKLSNTLSGGSRGGGGSGSSSSSTNQPQSLGGGAYTGTPTDTGTGQAIVAVNKPSGNQSQTYYSSNPNFVPKDTNATVVYYDKNKNVSQVRYGEQALVRYDIEGNPIGIETDVGGGMQSMRFSDYEKKVKEYEDLQKVTPRTKYVDTKTGKISDTQTYENKFVLRNNKPTIVQSPALTQIYTDPQTGLPIQNIGDYIEKYNIPVGNNNKSQEEISNAISRIREGNLDLPLKTYDLSSLSNKALGSSGGYLVGDTFLPSVKGSGQASAVVESNPIAYRALAGQVYGAIEVPIALALNSDIPAIRSTAGRVQEYLDSRGISKLGEFAGGTSVKEVLEVGKYGAVLLGADYYVPKIVRGAIGVDVALDIADIGGYYTGANVKIKEGLKTAQAFTYGIAEKIPSYLSSFKTQTYATGFTLGVLSELPAQSQTELAVQVGLIGALSSESRLIKGIGKTALFSGGAYQVYSGETYEEKALGALGILAVTPDILTAGRKIRYSLSDNFVKAQTDITGIQYATIDLGKTDYKMVDPTTIVKEVTSETIKVEFIPSRKEVFTQNIDPLKVTSTDIPLKEKPSLPFVSDPQQQKILDVVKERGDIVSGSYAQKVFVEGSRQFKDIDIISYNEEALVKALGEKLGDNVKITKPFKAYVIEDVKTGKELANIVKLSEGEYEGLATTFETPIIDGIKVLPPEARLLSKVYQQTSPVLPDKKLKIALDISQLTGRPELETSPSLLRGYGLSKEQQKLAFLEGDFFSTHGGQDLLTNKGEIVIGGVEVGSPELFYTTPSPKSVGVAYARKSRLGIGVGEESLTIRDIFKGEKFSFLPTKKDVIIEVGRLGDDFVQPNLQTSEIEVARVLPKEGKKLNIFKRFRTIIDGQPVEIAFARDVINDNVFSNKEVSNIQKLISDKIETTRRINTKKLEITPRINKPKQDIDYRRQIEKRLDISPDLRIFREERTTRKSPRTPNRNTRVDNILRDIERTDTRISEPRIYPREIRTPRNIREARNARRILNPRITTKESKFKNFSSEEKKKRKTLQKIATYQVLLRRRGKFRPIRDGLSKSEALQLGSDVTLKDLARTFKIRQTNTKEVFGIEQNDFIPREDLFRQYQVRRGKIIQRPDIFIQRTKSLLGTREEKMQIAQARRNKLMGGLID